MTWDNYSMAVQRSEIGVNPEPKYVPLEPETAGWGITIIVGTIRSRAKKLKPQGEEVEMIDTQKVVATSKGSKVVNVRPDGSMDADEARRIMTDDIRTEATRAGNRRSARRRRERKKIEKEIKTGTG
jgi:hypothetical protein